MIILIISIILIIIVTEIAYFRFFRGTSINNNNKVGNFVTEKILSICFGVLVWLFLIFIPCAIKEQEGYTYLQVFGWYYGVLISILVFFGINWYITKHLENKKVKKK